MERKCCRCKKWLSLSHFYKSKFGFSSKCKKCVKEYEAEYRSRPEVKERNRIWRKKYRRRPEAIKRRRITQRQWREKNPEKSCFCSYRSEAKKRKLEFDLTFEQFMAFWQKPCYYCGSAVKTIGLDRVDNSKGYIITNVVSCCWRCNDWKKASSQSDFLNHCYKITKLHP